MDIAYLACPGTITGSPSRRADAHEHDLQLAAIACPLEGMGHRLIEIDWHAPVGQFSSFAMALIGTVWDYQDEEAAFLARLEEIEGAGIAVFNPPEMVRWNARKTYLRDLQDRAIPTIETLWHEKAGEREIAAAFDLFGSEALVIKRQTGAGALGQLLVRREAGEPTLNLDQPVMIQPFLPSIMSQGELSFIFIDGEFSHGLRKRPAPGDYRVQSLYGGKEEGLTPSPDQLAAARQVLDAIPFSCPLYARIDMIARTGDEWLLIEAELIEPYLYPEQGPKMGAMLARALARRLESG